MAERQKGQNSKPWQRIKTGNKGAYGESAHQGSTYAARAVMATAPAKMPLEVYLRSSPCVRQYRRASVVRADPQMLRVVFTAARAATRRRLLPCR